MPTIRNLAAMARDALAYGTRVNGEGYVYFGTDAPEWAQDMAQKAHGDLLPDDYRYSYIAEALDMIMDCSVADDADADAILEAIEDSSMIQADVYNADLLRWVSSNLTRMGYVDDAIQEWGGATTLSQVLAVGQANEREEVLRAVLDFLSECAESM